MPPAFVPSNELEEVLVRAVGDPTQHARFHETLLASRVVLLTSSAPSRAEARTLQPGEDVDIVTLRDSGKAVVPLFSSLQAMEQALQERREHSYGYIVIPAPGAFELLSSQRETWAVLNPGLPYGKEFHPDEIRRLADGSIERGEQRRYTKATEIMIGEPAEYPHRLVDVLKTIYSRHPGVEAAYLAQYFEPGSGDPPHPLIGVLGQGYDEALREAGPAAERVMNEGSAARLPVDFIRIDPQDRTGPSDYFLQEARPFYERASRKPFWKLW